MYGMGVGIGVYGCGCRDGCSGMAVGVYGSMGVGISVGMGVWAGCRDQCMGWV